MHLSFSSVHLKLSEKMSLVAGRDGGLQNMEVLGMIMLRVTEPNLAKIRVSMDNREDRPVQFQVRKMYCRQENVGS